MSTSEPSPPTELASSPSPGADPLPQDSGTTAPDPVELVSADEPNPAASDLPVIGLPPIEAAATRSTKREPALADSSIFDVSDFESRGVEAPIFEEPVVEEPVVEEPVVEEPVVEEPVVEAPVVEALVAEAPVVEAPVVEAPVAEALVAEAPVAEALVAEAAVFDAPVTDAPAVDSSSADAQVSDGEEMTEGEPALAAFGDLAAFDTLAPRKRAPLPPLVPERPDPGEASLPADADDDAEWELSGELTSVAQKEEATETTAAVAPAPVEPGRPWRDVDDLEDDENSEELTGVLHNEEPAAKAGAGRPWRDVDDLEDDDGDDDPSEHLPTRVLGMPAPTISQRALVPPPAPRGGATSRAPGSFSLPAIPPPPTLPRSVSPSVPPVALDWIRERTGGRAGSLTLIVGGLVLLIVGIVPLFALGALVAGPVKALFAPESGSLVVTVAGANHGPVEAPVVVADDVPRCKESPCRITKLEPGTHFVRVTAPGYQQMAPRAVTVEEGGEVVLHVELAREAARVTVANNAPSAPIDLDDPSVRIDALPRSGRASSSTTATESVRTAAAVSPRAAAGPASGEMGTLNLSSTPASNVVLDGRPLGVTPRAGIKVKPGKHQVVFIHPKLGRKTAAANVKPGSASNVAVRFR